MAKTNIVFNNTNYSIDDTSLSAATNNLRTHLSTVMNGSGATINLGGTSYNVDSTKLSAATNDFITHLGTIAGSGSKVTVNGREYGIDSAKVAGAVAELESVFSGEIGEERLEGDGAEYYTLAPTALSFRSTAPLNELQDVQINGITVDPSNYTLEEGSTIVTFPIDYLKTLDVGSYEVAVASDSKTVKGDFTVAAPELNEYGFYYNQPYTAYVAYFGENETVFIREGGVLDIIGTPSGQFSQATYTISGNNINVVSPIVGVLNGTISADGSEIFINELATNFKLASDNSVAADKDYIYIYKEEFGGYEVTTIHKDKSEYEDIKTGINGTPTVALHMDAFKGNDNLVVAPKLPDSITSICESQFRYCTNLTTITLPASLIDIGYEAFLACRSLQCIDIPHSVEHIESRAFANCNNITRINIPSSATSIGQGIFTSCSNLTSITVSSENPVYCSKGNCLIQTASKELIAGCKTSIIPDDGSVKIIQPYAFKDIRGITSIFIPDGVTTIYYGSFTGCMDVTSISIPASLINVSEGSFDGASLTNIVFRGTKQQFYKIEVKLKKSIELYDVTGGIIEVVCSDGTEIMNIESSIT